MPLAAPGVVQIQSADSEHVIALYNPLILTYFSKAPSEAELAILRDLVDRARREDITGGGMLFVVARRNAAGGIQPRVREFFEQMVREHSASAGASAAVILMKGFGASLMRSFLTGLLVLSRKRKMFQIFGAVDEACRWLAPLHGLDAATLIRVYEEVTAAARSGV